MTVYVLIGSINYYCDDILGVYANKQEADRECGLNTKIVDLAKTTKRRTYNSFEVLPFEVIGENNAST